MALNPKQQRFVTEYLVDLNATQAAIRAGYSKKCANRNGPRLLSNAVIQEALQERYQQIVFKGSVASPEEVLGGFTNDTRFDPRKLFDENGDPLPIADLPDEAALSLTGFEIDETVKSIEGEEKIINRKYKYKLPDKHKNRKSLGEYHKLFESDSDRMNRAFIELFRNVLPPQAWEKLLSLLGMKLNEPGDS